MDAYYQAHSVTTLLYLLVVLGWYPRRESSSSGSGNGGATSPGWARTASWPPGRPTRSSRSPCFSSPPHIAPAAAFGHNAAGFAVGMVMLVGGVALRLWSFRVLGRYFTFTVKVSPDQPVVTAGPYRLLRHPGYAGGLLATAGIGVLWGNWVSLAVIVLPLLAIIAWRRPCR
jgi:Phospholipid methyltransferase